MREHYIDNCATTLCDPDVAQVALELMTNSYGNPTSLHAKGLQAQLRVEHARRQLADAVGAESEEILFTSGGTHANNLAILGAAEALKRRGNRIVAMSGAHASMLEPLKQLGQHGFEIVAVDAAADGNADPDAILSATDENTVLVCLELVNGEVGTITPVAELARALRRKSRNVFLHCDAVQALGKERFSAARLGVDSLSVSGHKIHAPKGVGALYLRRGARVLPRHFGGGQERGLFPGTENTPAICAFGHAAQKAMEQFDRNYENALQLKRHFTERAENLDAVCINSPPNATPYIGNLSVPGIRSETMLHFLAERGIYVSSSSACSGGAASHVLQAMGLSPVLADSALRLGFSKYTTIENLDAFFNALEQGINTLARSKVFERADTAQKR